MGDHTTAFAAHRYHRFALVAAVGVVMLAPLSATQNSSAAGSVGPQVVAAPTGPATATGATCESTAPSPTVVGSNGDDVLLGTPGRDVIAGGNGHDIVYGLGGNDMLLGGNGNDTLYGGDGADLLLGGNGTDTGFGNGGDDSACGGNDGDVLVAGAGNDSLAGGNGDDILSAGFGDDRAVGENGDDLLTGGPGDDDLRSGNGSDIVGGGFGLDRMVGDNGNDRLSGGEELDDASGGLGADSCSAETTSGCEATHGLGTGSATVTEADDPGTEEILEFGYDATATRGVRLVELYVADDAVAHRLVTTPASRSQSGTLAVPRHLVGPDTQVFVAITDIDGEQTPSEPIAVNTGGVWAGDLAQTVLALEAPTPIGHVVDALAAAGLEPIEYHASGVETAPMQADPDVIAQMEAAGDHPYVLPGVNVIYEPQGTPLQVQDEDLTGLYRSHGITGTPLITSLSVAGPITRTDLGDLASKAVITGQTEARDIFVESSDEPDPGGGGGPVASLARTNGEAAAGQGEVQQAEDQKIKDGRPGSAGARRATAAVEPSSAFWPLYGQFDVEEREQFQPSVAQCYWGGAAGTCHVIERDDLPVADLHHTLAFTPEVLAGYAERGNAFEQNVKVKSDDGFGVRPICNPFTPGDFYVKSETSSFAMTNVPDSVELYNDTVIAEDSCQSNEVSFGMVHPERLIDEVPDGTLPVVLVTQTSERDDDARRDFTLAAQTLTRDDYFCDSLPTGFKKNCIGLDADQTRQATLARTGGATLDVSLPTCVAWRWLPVGSESDSPTYLTRCGADSDADGWVNDIDCAPYDYTINPGAVDIPNDGIDQNCDGTDLVVSTGRIQVTLVWDNDNDMDLYVTEPTGREISYNDPGPTEAGGYLDRDDNVGVCGRDPETGGVENTVWEDAATPPPGGYTVTVDRYNSCGSAEHWTLEVRIGGELVATRNGSGNDTLTFTY